MKIKSLLTIFAIAALISGLTWATDTAFADTPCDSAYVTVQGNTATVKPTGLDDTANLQCAFDVAETYGAGTNVQLEAGTFYTGQIVVNNFRGTFTGAGMEKTTIMNLPNLYVTPDDFFIEPPSAENPWAVLFAFINGDFAVSELAIHITGENPTTAWTVWGLPPFTKFSNAVIIVGEEAHAEIHHFLLEGEAYNGDYNMINGIYYEGFSGSAYPWSPVSGSYHVHDSIFRHMGYATPIFNTSGATVLVSHNTYEDTFIAMDVSDTQNTSVEFSHNKVSNAVIGFDVWDNYAPEHVGSSFLVRNNAIQGMVGFAFEQTFGAGNKCLILGNNLEDVEALGIYLGPGTTGCTVIGGNNKVNVFDEGIDNVLTGVNNMGLGIGPDISSFVNKRP